MPPKGARNCPNPPKTSLEEGHRSDERMPPTQRTKRPPKRASTSESSYHDSESPAPESEGSRKTPPAQDYDNTTASPPAPKRQKSESRNGTAAHDHQALSPTRSSGFAYKFPQNHLSNEYFSRFVQPSTGVIDVDLESVRVIKKVRRQGIGFPRFKEGTVYIEVATSLNRYNFAFERALLTRVSGWFKQELGEPTFDDDVRLSAVFIIKSGYDVRFKLEYVEERDIWVLKKQCFTSLAGHEKEPVVASVQKLPQTPRASQTSNDSFVPTIELDQKLKAEEDIKQEAPEEIDWMAKVQTCQNSGGLKSATENLNGSSLDRLEDHPSLPLVSSNQAVSTPRTHCSNVPHSPAAENGHQLGPQEHIVHSGVSPSQPSSITKCGVPLEICEAYNNLFLLWHDMVPNISSTDINVALQQTELLVFMANYYESVPAIRIRLSTHLLIFGRELYKAILKDPPRWLWLSIHLECVPVFQEALIHIIGYSPNWPWEKVQMSDFAPDVQDLLISKTTSLKLLKAEVNVELFNNNINIDGKDLTWGNLSKSTIDTWFIVQTWRDWFCSAVSSVRQDKYKIGKVYRSMGKGSNPYLTSTQVYEKLVEFKMLNCKDFAVWNFRDVDEDLAIMKNFAKTAVSKLIINNSMLDIEEAGIEHLTCTKLENGDLPWVKGGRH